MLAPEISSSAARPTGPRVKKTIGAIRAVAIINFGHSGATGSFFKAWATLL